MNCGEEVVHRINQRITVLNSNQFRSPVLELLPSRAVPKEINVERNAPSRGYLISDCEFLTFAALALVEPTTPRPTDKRT